MIKANAKQFESKRHHWWPQAISKRWLNKENIIYQVFSNGREDIPQNNTTNFGVIKNAHSIKFSTSPTLWDQSFEGIFQSADDAFPKILDWLEDLQENKTISNLNFLNEEKNLDILLECLLSLIVRSPRFRSQIKCNIEHFRNNADETTIKLNLRDALNRFKTSLQGRGKFAVIFSDEQEFIFGDGFYHNFTSSINAPILPNICIFYSRPISYRANQRLIKMKINNDDIIFINQTTMLYSRDYIFYRNQRPEVTENFTCGSFLEYDPNGDPVIKAFSHIFQ